MELGGIDGFTVKLAAWVVGSTTLACLLTWLMWLVFGNWLDE